LTGGILVAGSGVAVIAIAGLGTSAYWVVALAGALAATLAYAIPTIKEAPRLGNTAPPDVVQAHPHQPQVSDPPKDLALGMAGQKHGADYLSPQRVIVITVHTTSGKTEIAERLIEDHPNWGWASCGRYVKTQARVRGLGNDHATTNTVGQRLVDKLGGDRFLSEVLDNSNLPPHPPVLVIDDVYHEQVYDAIKRRFPHLNFVSVNLPPSMREHLTAKQDQTAHPLDEAFGELTTRHQPDLSVLGAADEQQVLERTQELERELELVA